MVKKGPKSPPKRAKTSPRRPQDPPKTTQDPPRSPLGTILELSWDHPITRSKTRSTRCNSSKLFGSILAPKMPPKTTPKRHQNESKIKTKNASLFYRSWTRLGPVLRRSWAPSWGQKSKNTFKNVGPRENWHFRKNDRSRRIFDPT